MITNEETPLTPATPFCSLVAQESGQPPFGTAVHVTVWLLLEYSFPWTAQATTDNELPPPIQTWLAEQLRSVPGSRLQFIKRPQATESGVTLYVAVTNERLPRFYRFKVSDYHSLSTITIAALIADPDTYIHHQTQEQLYLICTNGRRDQCCAKFGQSVYHALTDYVTERQSERVAVWQTTHLGGHRFAATLVCLPSGRCYGHLHETTVAYLMEQENAGNIWLDKYRGDSRYAEPVQAAEYFLRRETNILASAAFQLQSAEQGPGNEWLIQFRLTSDDVLYQVRVTADHSPTPSLVSCSPVKYKPVPQYELLDVTRFNQG